MGLRYRGPMKLPREVISLDVETTKTSFKTPEKSRLVIAGCATFKLVRGRKYESVGYEVFYPTDLKALCKKLRDCKGIIIGHNVLQFDLRVLSPHLNVKPLIKKIVDTFAALYLLTGGTKRGYSLNNLSWLNLRKRKTLDIQSLRSLISTGSLRKVITYNKRDCNLTFNIWHKMVQGSHLRISEFEDSRISISLKNYLTGKKSICSTQEWISQSDCLLKNKINEMFRGISEAIEGNVYHSMYCHRCSLNCVFEGFHSVYPGMGNDAPAVTAFCPQCNGSIGHIRSFTHPTLIGVHKGSQERRCIPSDNPVERIIQKRMIQTKSKWQSRRPPSCYDHTVCWTCGNPLSLVDLSVLTRDKLPTCWSCALAHRNYYFHKRRCRVRPGVFRKRSGQSL